MTKFCNLKVRYKNNLLNKLITFSCCLLLTESNLNKINKTRKIKKTQLEVVLRGIFNIEEWTNL